MSGKAADALASKGSHASRIRVHLPGINLEHFHPLPRQGQDSQLPWRHDDALRVLLVGNMVPGKGIREFIMAIADVAARAALAGRVEFALVGNGDIALVNRMVSSLRLQDIVTHKMAIPYDAMPRLYASTDLFVLPSIPTPVWEEQFGMVLAESMACGKAVISTQSGAIPEVVGDTGVLVPPYDYRALADAMADPLLDDRKRVHEENEQQSAHVNSLTAISLLPTCWLSIPIL